MEALRASLVLFKKTLEKYWKQVSYKFIFFYCMIIFCSLAKLVKLVIWYLLSWFVLKENGRKCGNVVTN